VPNTEAVEEVAVQPTRVFVQAGAFADKAKADALAAKLRRFGQAHVSASKAGGKTLYRVRLGPVRSVQEGERLMVRVQGAGGGQARVVIE
jgi:rare lipoprotein A